MTLNRQIYNTFYSAKSLELSSKDPYQAEMVRIRMGYNEKYCAGKDVLDLCCGSGSYLAPILPQVRSAIGLDFSRKLLLSFQDSLERGSDEKLKLVEGDAQQLPFPNNLVDFVFSYCSLYYLPRLDLTFKEIGRVLRPGGHAALECGNLYSLNQPVSMAFHKTAGWAKPFFHPYSKLLKWLDEAGLERVESRAFQLLPMYGTPAGMLPLLPILSPKWKKVLGLQFKGRMLDEWISRSWPLRNFAFRHFFLVRKRK
jgi:ubiquinone/menaquinone biosynthesis C-methylase UbiE